MVQDIFVKIEASKLSFKDKFMSFCPRTEEEHKLYDEVVYVIKTGVKDFWRPKYDPSFSEDGTNICYVPGKKPAVGKSHEWWKKVAKEFKPECESRLGTKYEYIAFLAVLIKNMVANGWKVSDAWYAVCNSSERLGHYWNSVDAWYRIAPTGCHEFCDFFDLANVPKFLAGYEGGRGYRGFWYASGNWKSLGGQFPLANLVKNFLGTHDDYNMVGWLVFDSCPDC